MSKQLSHPEVGAISSLISMSLSLCSADFLISCLLLACLKPGVQLTAQALLPDWRPIGSLCNQKRQIAHKHVCTGTPSWTRGITCCISNSHGPGLLSLPLECFSAAIIETVSEQTNFFCSMEFAAKSSSLSISSCSHWLQLLLSLIVPF